MSATIMQFVDSAAGDRELLIGFLLDDEIDDGSLLCQPSVVPDDKNCRDSRQKKGSCLYPEAF